MFRKKGKTFPVGAKNEVHENQYARAIAEALREELGDTHRTIKTAMRWTGANERTVKNWLAGTSGPSGEHLVLLFVIRSPLETFLGLAGRETMIAQNKLISMRQKLKETLELIDALAEKTD